MQDELDKREQLLCIAMKKPIVPNSPKPFWQYMLHDEMQELFALEGAEFYLTSLAINVLECDQPLLV